MNEPNHSEPAPRRRGKRSGERRATKGAIPGAKADLEVGRRLDRLTHEVSVQQEELEIQNRQLIQSQRLLEESRDRFASLYDFAPVPYITLCANGVIREINLTGAALLGQERDRLIDRPFILFVEEPYRRSFLNHVSDLRNGRRPPMVNLVLRGAGGREIPVEMRTSELVGDPGNTGGFLSVLIDVSDRQRLEEERERVRVATQSERLLRTVLESLPVAVRVIDMRGESVMFNEACRLLWGIDAGSPLPPWEQQRGWHPKSNRRLLPKEWPVAVALVGTSVVRQMIHAQGFDGRLHVLMQSAIPLVDDAGAVSGAVEVTEDVTLLLEAQTEAQRRQQQLEAAFDAAHLSFWDWDFEDNRVTWSGPFADLFTAPAGRARSNDPAEAMLRRVHPDDRQRVSDALTKAGNQRSVFEQEFRVQWPDGPTRWLAAKGSFAYRRGRPVRMSGVVIDITAQKSLQTRLTAAKEEAENASRLKDDFLATVSHELRTPLSAIMLWAHLVVDALKDPAEISAAMDTILRSASAQAKIIDDLLDISRSIAGKMALNLRPGSVAAPVQAAVDIVRPTAEAKRVKLQVDLPQDLPLASVDADRIQQIAWNLLTNAVKFSPSDHTVSVSLQLAQPERGAMRYLQLKVADQGIGIDPGFLPHVFDRFRQADSGITRAHGGLGLGLAITRELVERHGGRVRAESAGLDKGATFIVEIPALPELNGASASSPQHAKVSLQGFDILLVEDEPVTRNALKQLLQTAGASVRAAASAAEAIEMFGVQRPDVLVSDIAMPVHDGLWLVDRIRQMEAQDKSSAGGEASPEPARVPAIALTAHAYAGDRMKCMEAGFQVHLSKPVEPEDLVATIATFAPT